MRYFFISDVHGEYDKMVEALDKNGFKPNNDTLVTVGDLFDRGEKSLEVLQYVMGLPHKICLWGNHDYRLKQVIVDNEPTYDFDNSNGMNETLSSFCHINKADAKLYWLKQKVEYFNNNCTDTPVYKLLMEYFEICWMAAEFEDLIATHAWLPVIDDQHLVTSWRYISSEKVWEYALWCNSFKYFTHHLFDESGKKFLIGHWHAADFHNWKDGWYDNKAWLNNDTFHCTLPNGQEFIAIDGCSNAEEGKVNVYIYESENEPTLYGFTNGNFIIKR